MNTGNELNPIAKSTPLRPVSSDVRPPPTIVPGLVAEQMYPDELHNGPNRLSARLGLAQVVGRKQKHALEQRYGFRRLDVITRWEQQSQGLSGPQSHGEGT
ncbi:hypothetical protein OKW40_005568 [Paraburkholderia sp. RAU6.4a]|uniref:hypothetical protein n=1 Tax=Paraburkholderia sp. RAU6.4a TaxID=2991067 RepID=UPI003D19CE9D